MSVWDILAGLFSRPAPAAPIPAPPADMLGAATLPAPVNTSPEHVNESANATTPTADRFAHCLPEVLKHEGGFVNHPADPGGATNRGITRATLAEWRGKPVSVEDVRALTVAEAGEIYRARYWDKVQGDKLPAGLDLAVFDYAVNSGPGRAAKALQKLVEVPQDGGIGPITLAAINAVHPTNRRALVGAFCDARLAFLRGLGTWPTFGKGWTSRVEAVRAAAKAMLP